MASIFTFDPDPPRVASPWAAQHSPRAGVAPSALQRSRAALVQDFEHLTLGPPEDLGVTRLAAEPQEGPTEYKLHLLLRPRRSFAAVSTEAARQTRRDEARASPPQGYSVGSRQHRLEQLTTQLLWRLQQSAPLHSSSATNVILPKLLDPEEGASPHMGRVLPGLEESKGALYEIGVSDDGTFVGLAKDEMVESLNNLRTMAGALGCSVELLRMVPVGECEWVESDSDSDERMHARKRRRGHLWVAEAYIKPELRRADEPGKAQSADGLSKRSLQPAKDHVSSVQLRVSITGATTSGKSTLLGTLSTSALDNGRGSSRLSLLKHRHEIASGVTSSVAQELLGYRDEPDAGRPVRVVNYGTDDVVSWNNVHAASTSRLALLTDSAGHPRFRRTTVRGLVSWAPHWTMLCIAANGGTDGDLASVVSDPSFSGASAHLSMAHLDLCLRLELPLVVVVTKLDAANKTTFRHILSALLSMLKAAGRKPVMMRSEAASIADVELGTISAKDNDEVEAVCQTLAQGPTDAVPIVLTSAVSGQGIGKVHAFLRHLPIPLPTTTAGGEHDDPAVLFHIDDTFQLPPLAVDGGEETGGCIVSGYLGRGRVSIGDEVLLGPYSATQAHLAASQRPFSLHEDPFLTPRSFGEALTEATSSPRQRVQAREQEWRRVRVVSVRHLRLPVHSLQGDQVGTIGLVGVDGAGTVEVRKGMVVSSGQPQGAHSLTVSFSSDDVGSLSVGAHVVLYCASMRESARVIAVAAAEQDRHRDETSTGGDPFAFDMDEGSGSDADEASEGMLVTFQLTSYRAWVQGGQRVLAMPSHSPASDSASLRSFAGFDGFVGRIVDTFG